MPHRPPSSLRRSLPLRSSRRHVVRDLASRRGLPLLLALALLTAAGPPPAAAQEADPADVASIDAIVTAVYDAISGEAGEARDWDRFRSLFAEGATLSAVVRTPQGELTRVVMTPETYIRRSSEALERDGFVEAEIGRVTEEFASIAHAFSAYESYRSAADEEPFARGINSFQFMNDGDRWWIVSIFWQGEGPETPIPDEYIGGIR